MTLWRKHDVNERSAFTLIVSMGRSGIYDDDGVCRARSQIVGFQLSPANGLGVVSIMRGVMAPSGDQKNQEKGVVPSNKPA